MQIEVLVSTYNEGITKINFSDAFHYVVVHQVDGAVDESQWQASIKAICDNPKVKYVRLEGKGLSRSRNTAIANSHAEYLWIMDDDVRLYDDAYTLVPELLSEQGFPEMLVVNHAADGSRIKAGREAGDISGFKIAGVSSIDMIVKREFVQHSIKFDENCGLGTALPSGEEYVFCHDLLAAGGRITRVVNVCSYHPEYSSGMDFFSSANKLLAKRYMFRRCHGTVSGYFLYLAFITKKLPVLVRGKAVLRALKTLL